MTNHVLRRSAGGCGARRVFVALVAAVLALSLFNSSACAQGTSGSLPDPMSSSDLDKIMDRLELDDAQRRVAESVHEQYIEDFKKLREGEIEEYLEKLRTIQGNMPDRKQIEDFISGMERLQDKIARLDNTFFDQLMATLRDEQQVELTRARMYRTRERHTGDIVQVAGMLVPAAKIDLSDLYDKLKLTPDEKLMIQTAVMDYESKLTRLSREMADSVIRMFLDIFDIIEAAGFNNESFQDPEKAQEAFNVMREAWKTVSARMMEKAMEVSDLNRRSLRRISEMLPSDHAERLTMQYYEQAYPELPSSNLRQLFRKALKFDDLTDEQWMNVSVMRDEFRRQEQKLYEEMADIRDSLRATSSPFEMGGMGGQAPPQNDEIIDKLDELNTKHTKLVDRTTESLNVLLGADLQVKINEMQDPLVAEALAEAAQAEQEVDDTDFNRMPEPAQRTAEQPISVPEFAQAMAMLNLDDAAKAVAEELHAAYVTRFTQVSEEVLGKVNEAQGKLWHFDEATSTTTGPTTEQVKELHELRKSAGEAMRGVDEAFFNDLAVALGTEPQRQLQLDMLRNVRMRASYAMGADMWIWGFGGQHSQVASVDLVKLCMDEQLLDAPSEAFTAMLTTYDAEMTQAMRSRHEQGRAAQHRMDLANAEFTAAAQDSEDGPDVAAGVRYQQELEAMSTKLNETSQKVAQLNRDTLPMLLAELSEEDAARAEMAFKKAAYPTVYRGIDMINGAIAKARSLNSLSETQRTRLEEVLGEFEAKHDAICERMVALLSSTSGAIRPFGAENMREYQRVESAMEQMEFERDELRARTRRRVQDVLTDEQLLQIGSVFARKGATAATTETATP